VLAVLASSASHAAGPTFRSSQEALKQGVAAYSGGYYEIAIPALEHAAAQNELMANYYLARIYSDNSGSRTDHAKAYVLFQQIADELAEVDPDEDPRAPFAGKALTALAGYVRRGLPEIGLKPNPELAADYLHNASVSFNDEDAQFELAKMQLTGEGVDSNVAQARHYLAVLSQKGHAGAQAFLADLLWHGKYMPADPVRALALISVAVSNAPQYDRLWIEDIYQTIYCGAAEGIRKQATGVVAGWGNRFGRKPDLRDRNGPLVQVDWTCTNGEPVVPIDAAPAKIASEPVEVHKLPETRTMVQGSAVPGLRDVGATLAPIPTTPER
jgi:hypothetical protein